MKRRNGLGLLIALAALAAAGRLAFIALPNVSLAFLVIAVAGLAYGARLGAGVGVLAMVITSAMIGSVGPGAMLAASVMGAFGALFGVLRFTGFPGRRRTRANTLLAAALGGGLWLCFSVAADAGGWALFAWLPHGAAAVPLFVPLVLGGLLFNVPGAIFQAVLFGAALQPVIHALRAAGLAEDPRRARAARQAEGASAAAENAAV